MEVIKKRTIKYYRHVAYGKDYFFAYVHEPPRKRTILNFHNAIYVEIPGCCYRILLREAYPYFYALTIGVLLHKENKYYHDAYGSLFGGLDICLGDGYNPYTSKHKTPEAAVDSIVDYLWESQFTLSQAIFEIGPETRSPIGNALQEVNFNDNR